MPGGSCTLEASAYEADLPRYHERAFEDRRKRLIRVITNVVTAIKDKLRIMPASPLPTEIPSRELRLRDEILPAG